MNTVFMGTPDFAVPSLKALIESGENVQAVFTQPDKPKGRGYKLAPPPVKVTALERGIPVYQPVSLKTGEDARATAEVLKELAPDSIIVAAYGQILPLSVLEAPKKYCINVHASLLPKYRGAAPIQRCILEGEKVTGITTMLMAEGIDTGDMLLKTETEIEENETASELHDRLAVMGAELLLDTLKRVKSNSLTPIKQDDSLACYAPMLTKDMCPIDFTRSAAEVHNHIRGLSAFPCAYAVLGGKRLKVYKSAIVKGVRTSLPHGTIIGAAEFTGYYGDNFTVSQEDGSFAAVRELNSDVMRGKRIYVSCGDGGIIAFTEVQAEGGKRLSVTDYLRGNPVESGMRFNI